jgi:SpoIIAA-like
MIRTIPDLPDHVLGFTASGKVTAADYESVIVPAVEHELKARRRVRLLYHLGADFAGFDMGALWADAKIGLHHPAAWERVALVSDVDWLRSATKVLGFAMPGRVRVFANSELAEATRWVAE